MTNSLSGGGGGGGGRWLWVSFQFRGVLLIWITVGQGPTALAVGAGGGCLDIFTLIYPFSLLSPSLWETARYRLKYCLKGPLNPKTTNQPTLSGSFQVCTPRGLRIGNPSIYIALLYTFILYSFLSCHMTSLLFSG